MNKVKLSQRIKDERDKLGLKQSELAKKIGKSISNISGYEIGDRVPPAEVLSMLSDVFGCSVDYLLGKTDYRSAQLFTKIIHGHKVEIEALNEYAANKTFEQIEQLLQQSLK